MYVSRSEPVGPVTFSDGAALVAPSDGEAFPKVSSPMLKSHSHLPFIESDSDGEVAKVGGAL